jgi:SAM-dependent methyltransferase
MTETEVNKFWNAHPCGDGQLGGLDNYRGDYEAFFSAYDAFRYTKEAHILDCLGRLDVKGKRLLEIGLGQGADTEQLIRRGARWSGLELTTESVKRVRARLALRRLSYEELKQGSVLEIPYPSASFDIVFSHGVLHHVPEIARAQSELHRVLKPGGELVVMLYAKWSLNYLLSIALVRRLGLALLYFYGDDPGGIYGQHLQNARRLGLRRYLSMKNFIHRNTDGPLNPYSKVYDVAKVKNDFPNFEVVRSYKRFMYAPPLPVQWLPLERLLGWHLWVHLRPKS